MHKKLNLLLSALLLATAGLAAQDEMNCFSILVGKQASVDGSVLFAHIEDDGGKQLVNWIAVPRKEYPQGSEMILKDGGHINQPSVTCRHLWLEMPGMDFSDSYLNEYGVCIASNACSSREDKPEITDGGIGYNLRQLMAERAHTAREAVILAGKLVEQFGYTGSGRTYCIADPNEAWALAVVRGKHWVAQRVPDASVMVLPNNYTIREVKLDDPANFLACPDLVEYAVNRGWYNREKDGPFNFRNAYAGRNSVKHPGNVNRAWGAYHLFNTGYGINDDFPFSFLPSAPVSKKDLMKILRSHYEGTELDKSAGYSKGSPYQLNGSMICGEASVYGFVAELRHWMPADLGCVMWLAPQWPDIQPFIPLYAGVVRMPEAYCRPDYPLSMADHYRPPADIHDPNGQHAFWAFVEFSGMMNRYYAQYIKQVRTKYLKLESEWLMIQGDLEKDLLKEYEDSPGICQEAVSQLYGQLATQALAATRKTAEKIRKAKQ